MQFNLIRKSGLAVLTAVLAVMALAPRAHAQADYPNIQGAGQRPGHSTDPINYGSGRTILQWFTPIGVQATTTMVLDNTDFTNTAGFLNGPYDANPYGLVNWTNPGAWLSPPVVQFEATNPFREAAKVQSAPFNYATRSPDYYYTLCTPSIAGGDPTQGATASFTWEFLVQPNPNGTTLGFTQVAASYGLYVWLPAGPTGDGTATGWVYNQRYFVYQITYGNNQTYIDVVDTYQAGTGWVRLGNGGRPTNAIFPYDGTHPLQITLLNTIPRDINGNLTGTPQQCVYADAAMAIPINGTYNASPVSGYLRDATGNPLVDGTADVDVPGATSYFTRILVAENMLAQGLHNNQVTTVPQSQVRCYQMNPQDWTTPPVLNAGVYNNGVPTVLWSYSPLISSNYPNTIVNGTSHTNGWTVDNANPHYQGTNYLSAPIVVGPATDTVSYDPGPNTLENGAYSIYAYVPGNGGGETYGDQVQVQIFEGNYPAGPPIYTGPLNEAAGGGWVQLGTRQYNQANLADLVVVITNSSTDAADAGKLAYANAVKFVGAANLSINSTPVIAQVNIQKTGGGPPVLTQVAIVADESGKIHCLDYTGNGDGTTTEYWSYPSTRDPNNSLWTDPNLQQNIDGPASSTVPVAQMPTQFNLSTAVIQHLASDPAGQYRMYIASSNGRIYCLDMTGRGDYNVTGGQPGTTARLWSYPDDYPKSPAVVPSHLGAFRGSLVFGDAGDGLPGPTIFAGAPQGRVYALDAAGDTINRVTTSRWTYPALSAPSLPSIQMTPSLAFGNLYFGTLHDSNNDGPGRFYALNASTGGLLWGFDGKAGDISAGSVGVAEGISDFVTGPVTVPQAMLNEPLSPYTVVTQDSVYALNDNEHLYGFNAHTGALINSNDGTRPYDDNELGVTSSGNLGFEWITTYDRNFGQRTMPVIMVPTTEGHVYGLFANTDDYNFFSTFGANEFTSLLAWGYSLAGTNTTSAAFSNKRMILNDDKGYMYVWDDDTSNRGLEVAGNAPANPIYAPDQPGIADAFRYLHVKLVDRNTYQKLRSETVTGGIPQGNLDFVGAKAATTAVAPPAGQPYALEWGQTAYILVYGFKYAVTDSAGHSVPPPIVNIRISVAGKVVRQLQVDTATFIPNSPALYAPDPPADNWPASWNPAAEDGYGVYAFTILDGGANSLPPGPGTITADITTAAVNTNLAAVEVASDPNPVSPDPSDTTGGTVNFQVANPIAVEMTGPYSTAGDQRFLMGAGEPDGTHNYIWTNTYDIASLLNGSPDVTNTYAAGAVLFSQLLDSTGYVQDGVNANTTFNIYDRSLMTLVRPDGQGLGLLRIDRSGLQWQGGATTIYNRLDPVLYPGFEDAPVNSPNDSLDYPDITPDLLQFVANYTGSPENPLIQGVHAVPPTGPDGVTRLTETDSDTAQAARALKPTPVQATVDVPKYQPGVNVTTNTLPHPPGDVNLADDVFTYQKADSAKGYEPQGYYGNIRVYIDSASTGLSGDQTPYRTFHLAAGVTPDSKLFTSTPTVDGGSLATGTGYSPLNPFQQGANPNVNPGPFNPWAGIWSGVYQPFTVQSDSNYNMLNLRLAKGSDIQNPGAILPWAIFSGGNDILAWLDASTDLWSNLDSHFAMQNPNGPTNAVFLQKSRITDRVANSLNLNPVPRLNPNTGATGTGAPLNPAYPTGALARPAVAASIPLGFPAGTYSSLLRVIEDKDLLFQGAFPEVWDPLPGLNALEPATDPGVTYSLTVREARLTNGSTPNTAPMADSLVPNNAPAGTPTWRNVTPAAIRDAFGSIVAFWASDRTGYGTVATSPSTGDSTRLFFASVANGANFHNNNPSQGLTLTSTDPITGVAPTSPLRDLGAFVPGPNSWFTAQNTGGNGYPYSSLFPLGNGGAVVAGTEKYNLPAMPLPGERNPLWQYSGNTNPFFDNGFLAFVGSAQETVGSGRITQSQVFLSSLSTSSSGGVAPGNPVAVNDDPTTTKGKPSVVQTTDTDAFVFYPVTSANATGIHVDRYGSAGFALPISLNFGTGFDSATDPSAVLRPYYGANANVPHQLIDLTFSGRLRGRPNAEVYMGRLMAGQINGVYHLIDSAGNDVETPNAGSPFLYMPLQVNERLLSEGNGLFRARGVEWDRSAAGFALVQYQNGSPLDLVDDATKVVDRQTGLISYDSRLGGKVYIDPELGTVKFSTPPSASAEIRLSYTPAFLRVTNGGPAAYSQPTGLYDDHYVGFDPAGANYLMWRETNGNQAVAGDNVQSDRSVFFFGKSASGNGQTARPYMTTMRFGLRLPTRIFTGPGGAVASVVVTGNTGPYQLDPSNGRIYFTEVDEDRPVTVNYTGVNEADGSQIAETVSGNVSYVLEKDESPVLIDEAVNEGSLNAFLDPFTYTNGSGGAAQPSTRPLLVWMFYTSTRAGGPDVYFQTIAPSLLPVVK